MEKEYAVIVKRGISLQEVDAELTASTGAGPIPNRTVDIANPRLGSTRMTHWMLTDLEANELRNDARILAVEIPPDQRDDIKIGTRASQEGAFERTTVGQNTVNWGLRRCVDVNNNFNSITGSVSGNYNYALDGSGVDVVIQDSGIQTDHPEWVNTKDELIDTVQGGTATFNFVDNNKATYDLYVPYYGFGIPNYLASMTSTPWANGQYDGVEFLIRFVLANGETVERTRIFGGIGPGTVTTEKNTFEIDTDGTIAIEQTDEDLRLELATLAQNGVIQLWLLSGGSRLRQIDWYGASGLSGTQSANFYRDRDGHGTHCAGIAAGKTYGWAKGAHIYSQKLAGLETLQGPDGTGISTANAFDSIRLWHNAKTNGRPTVVNMSWGYLGEQAGNPTSGTYRGTPWTFNLADNILNLYGLPGAIYDGSARYPVQVSAVDAEIEDMIDAGIHICLAAGNDFYKADVVAGDDYNNTVVHNATTYSYHRPGSPYSNRAFFVGSIDNISNSGIDRPANYSKKGPAVNVWAPGSKILSTASNLNDTSYNSVTFTYPTDSNYSVMNIGGTSMASPQVAGLLALYLQSQPTISPDDLLNKVIGDSSAVISDTGLDNDYTADTASLMGSSNRLLYSRYGVANTSSITGSLLLSNFNLSIATT